MAVMRNEDDRVWQLASFKIVDCFIERDSLKLTRLTVKFGDTLVVLDRGDIEEITSYFVGELK